MQPALPPAELHVAFVSADVVPPKHWVHTYTHGLNWAIQIRAIVLHKILKNCSEWTKYCNLVYMKIRADDLVLSIHCFGYCKLNDRSVLYDSG